jgi:hypothetical protein
MILIFMAVFFVLPNPKLYQGRKRKAPLSDRAQKLIERLGETAKLPFPIHAHICSGMLLDTL